MPTPLTLLDLMRLSSDVLREQIHTALPARVVTYYPPTATAPATADIEIALNRPMVDAVTQTVAYEIFPQIPQVPIALPRGGGFTIAFPLLDGDEGLFVCSMYDYEGWRTTGQIADPVDPTAHGLQGWFLPTVVQDGKPMADWSAAAAGLVVGVDGKPGQIRIPSSGGEIDLGASPAGFAAIAAKVDNAVSTIVSAFNSHIHTAPAGTAGGPTTPPVTGISPAPGSTAAAVVKVQ